ncbi:hypothetical protein SAMN05192561_101954 [Halopenitus malekzadehii]|uniref:Uncharacterized protein n=1 Tax=Halopenitus malekzadehii TaxID=1267564 RepID=A0A1H6I5I5_9EURY|nr:hypothetical protein SAMN05192561_101954 [Halopenitus malekzadehii]
MIVALMTLVILIAGMTNGLAGFGFALVVTLGCVATAQRRIPLPEWSSGGIGDVRSNASRDARCRQHLGAAVRRDERRGTAHRISSEFRPLTRIGSTYASQGSSRRGNCWVVGPLTGCLGGVNAPRNDADPSSNELTAAGGSRPFFPTNRSPRAGARRRTIPASRSPDGSSSPHIQRPTTTAGNRSRCRGRRDHAVRLRRRNCGRGRRGPAGTCVLRRRRPTRLSRDRPRRSRPAVVRREVAPRSACR